jgi:hypothetical protein
MIHLPLKLLCLLEAFQIDWIHLSNWFDHLQEKMLRCQQLGYSITEGMELMHIESLILAY